MEEKIKEVLALLEGFDLYSFYRRMSPASSEDTMALETFLAKRGYGKKEAKVCHGMTKICIVFSDWDYVVKMDRKDYHECDTEVRVYSVAKQYKVERAFLETRKIGENSHGVSIYIQPKVSTSLEDLPRESIRKWKNRIRNHSPEIAFKVMEGFYSYPPRLWVYAAILCYGKKFMLELEKVTRICFINDLHESNVGFVKNKPVILDYSGFHGTRETGNDKYYIEMR